MFLGLALVASIIVITLVVSKVLDRFADAEIQQHRERQRRHDEMVKEVIASKFKREKV